MENMNIPNYVLVDVIRHVDTSYATNLNTSFWLDNGCVILRQDNWIIRFEGDGIVRLDNPDYGFGSQTYDDHAFYAKNGDFIETCKKRYIDEYRNGKTWEKVNAVINDEVTAYNKMYQDGKISREYANKVIVELNSVKHRKELFDAMK